MHETHVNTEMKESLPSRDAGSGSRSSQSGGGSGQTQETVSRLFSMVVREGEVWGGASFEWISCHRGL